MNEDALLNATVAINDNDIDDLPVQLAWTIVNGGTAAANGVLSMSSDGNFSYSPALNFTGTVAFVYELCDPAGACDQATVTIVINAVNDLDNVIYEISNESDPLGNAWQYHMIDFIRSYEFTKPKRHPVGMTAAWPNGTNATLTSSTADWVGPLEPAA